jgi:hypothetical protein
MMGTNNGLTMGQLVLLSCPALARYSPDYAHVRTVVSIRVHMDLVILADRGGQKFTDIRIRENVLPVWFDHSATHMPDVWSNVKYGIPAML